MALASNLADALASGTRKVQAWAAQHPHFIVEFPIPSLGGKPADPFFNANTPEELGEAAILLPRHRALY